MGAGLAQGGRLSLEKRIPTEQLCKKSGRKKFDLVLLRPVMIRILRDSATDHPLHNLHLDRQ